MNSQQAKRISIILFLEALGIFPTKISKRTALYLSPFRKETSPSFKVDIELNLWYDHGDGLGGNIIDLGIRLFNCSVSELLKRMDGLGLGSGIINRDIIRPITSKTSGKLEIIKISPLSDIKMLNYIQSRGIDRKIAMTFFCQAEYRVGEINFLSIAFLNSKGGFELINSRGFKNCASPKWITHLLNKANLVCIFEGMMDFMSLLSMRIVEFKDSDYIILNSLSFLDEIPELLKDYQTVHLYLDNDDPGEKATKWILTRNIRTQIIDKSDLYKDHKDLNDFLKDMIKKGK